MRTVHQLAFANPVTKMWLSLLGGAWSLIVSWGTHLLIQKYAPWTPVPIEVAVMAYVSISTQFVMFCHLLGGKR